MVASTSPQPEQKIVITTAARDAIQRGVTRADPVANLEYLGLSVRTINLLEKSEFHILRLEDLLRCRRAELLEIRNITKVVLDDILDCLARYDRLDDAVKQMPALGELKLSEGESQASSI